MMKDLLKYQEGLKQKNIEELLNELEKQVENKESCSHNKILAKEYENKIMLAKLSIFNKFEVLKNTCLDSISK